MEERDWSDYKLAKEANLSTSTVTNIFSRNTTPTLPTLEAICRAFGITLAQFFTEDEEPFALTSEQKRIDYKMEHIRSRPEKIPVRSYKNNAVSVSCEIYFILKIY